MEKDRSDNIALIDLDGTVCDHDGALERDLNLLRSPSEPLINISKWRDKSKMPSHISSRTYMIRDRSCWWRDLPPIQQGMDLVGAMSEMGYRIVVLTQGPRRNPSAWKGKVKWIDKYFPPHTDIVITRDKGIVYGKVLFDDYPDYLEAWLEHRPRGLAIMNDFEYNRGFEHPNVLRYRGKEDLPRILEALEKQLKRKPLEDFYM